MHGSADSHRRATSPFDGLLRVSAGSLVALGIVACAAIGRAQGTAQTPAPPTAQAGERAAGAQDTYVYRGARRDPFLSLVNRATEERPTQKKPEGIGGLSWNEIKLTGILQGGRPGAIAIVKAIDNKSYRLHVGDQLYDCTVKAISVDSLVGLQEVSDPLSMQKQREVRKTLRVVEEVK